MTFGFHPEAEAEFIEAVAFYERAEPSLGEEFSLEVRAAMRNVLSYPNAWPVLEGGVRRCLVNRFPYGILYSVATRPDLRSRHDAPSPAAGLLEGKVLAGERKIPGEVPATPWAIPRGNGDIMQTPAGPTGVLLS